MPFKLLDSPGQATLVDIGGSSDDCHCSIAKPTRDEARTFKRACSNRNVHSLLKQIDDKVALHDIDGNFRISLQNSGSMPARTWVA